MQPLSPQANQHDNNLQSLQVAIQNLNIARPETQSLSQKWGFVGNFLQSAGVALGVYSPPYPVFAKGASPIEQTSRDVWGIILKNNDLAVKDIASLSQTSKTMQTKCKKLLWNIRVESITYGAKAWEKILGSDIFKSSNLDFTEPPRPIDSELQSASNFFKNKKVHETCRLVLIPGGISLSRVSDLLNPCVAKLGFKRAIKAIGKKRYWKIATQKVEKPYWALITKEIIADSRTETYEDCYKMLFERGKNLYGIPRVIEATLLSLLDKCLNPESEELLYAGNWTSRYTFCIEIFENLHYSAGGFGKRGFQITSNDQRSTHGMLAVKRFFLEQR